MQKMETKTGTTPVAGSKESQKAREKARAEARVCPKCGEKMSSLYYLEKEGNPNKGVVEESAEECEILGKTMRRNRFHCLTCGAAWKSRPYTWER